MACGKPFMRSISKAGNIEALTVFRRRECCWKSCAAILRERRGHLILGLTEVARGRRAIQSRST
jgi:hypothetical protein